MNAVDTSPDRALDFRLEKEDGANLTRARLTLTGP